MSKSHFRFTKQERSGIFFLLLLIILLQGAYYFVKTSPKTASSNFEVDLIAQATLDSLKNQIPKDTIQLYPFNPNFITDYKGYVLGMSPEELDRLYAFRKQGKFVNSAQEFQKVTLVPDSVLEVISPYFKFPDWKQKSNKSKFQTQKSPAYSAAVKDLNRATPEDLKLINGIGDKLSARIIKFRDRLGGFLVDEQLGDVYGLEPEVVHRTLERFRVLEAPEIAKININEATAEGLARLIYIPRDLAHRIVAHRELNGPFESWDELSLVEGFPKERIGRFKLYLRLKN